MSFTDRFTYHLLKLAHGWLNRLFQRERSRFGATIGSVAFNKIAIRKAHARRHLKMAFPDKSDNYIDYNLRELHRHYGHMFIDALCGTRLIQHGKVTAEGKKQLDSAYSEGKGVILMAGHFGNWELIPTWLAVNGYQIVTVAQRQKNRGADRFFMEYRKKAETSPVYPGESPSDMISSLRAGKILILASDQNAGKHGEFVYFFGQLASSPRGADVFHQKTGAPVIVAFCQREQDGSYIIRFDQLPNGDSSASVMERFTTLLEKEIRKRPEQYFWFHRRWKTPPSEKP